MTSTNTTASTSDTSSLHLPSPAPLTAGGDGEPHITSIERGEATAEPTAKGTTGSPTNSLSDATAGLEEAGQVGVGDESGEEVDLSDLMTLLFQHLRTDEGRAEFQALVEAEEVKAAAKAEIAEKKEENEGEERSGEITEGDEEKRKPPVVKEMSEEGGKA